MQGWIIFKKNQDELTAEHYEILRFIEAATKNDIEIKVIKPSDIDLLVTREGRKSMLLQGEPTAFPDFVLPRMGAGTNYFAFAVIRQLERCGVHCFNSATSTEIVKDKLYSQQILAANDLPIPKTMLVKFPVDIDLVEKYLGFPVIVKTLSGSLGRGVFLSQDKPSFDDLTQLIESTNPNANIILQEFVKDSFGRDIRVFTIGGIPLACMERRSTKGDFKANFSAGGSVHPFELTPEIEWLSSEASRLLGLDIAGVDLLFDGKHFKICEVNSSPGFHGLEQVTDKNIAQEIFNYLRIRLGKFE